MIINYYNKTECHFLSQAQPDDNKGKFLDNKFLPDKQSLKDKNKKRTEIDKIKIEQCDWILASNLFKENKSLFPSKREKEEFHKVILNFRNNKVF